MSESNSQHSEGASRRTFLKTSSALLGGAVVGVNATIARSAHTGGSDEIKVALIGCGGITLQNHLPGLALCPNVKVVALCDTDATTLERAANSAG